MQGQLLTERANEVRFDTPTVLEDKGDGIFRFEAIVSEADFINRNARLYPMEVIWPAFEKANADLPQFPGTVDHPDPWGPVSVSDLGIMWEKFWMEPGEKLIRGRGKIIETTKGLNLKAAMRAGVAVGFSTRARAKMEEVKEDGKAPFFKVTEMSAPYVDAVTDPSVGHARVTATKEEAMEKELEALAEQHTKALEALQAEHTTAVEAVEARAAAAETALAEARAEIERLTGELDTFKAEAAATAFEAKLVTLTKDDRFAATIVRKVSELKEKGIDVNTENVETYVEMLRSLVNNTAAAANESTEGEPRGTVDNESEDAAPAATESAQSTGADPELVELRKAAGF